MTKDYHFQILLIHFCLQVPKTCFVLGGITPAWILLTESVSPEERRLPHSKLFQPDYSRDFRCIGPACEDSCCAEWTVHVDQSTFEKYQNLPAGPLRTIVEENVLRTPELARANGSLQQQPSPKSA